MPLFVRDLGKGPPLVLLHPFPLHGGAFDDLEKVARLSSSCRLVVPDLPGFGKSAVDRSAESEPLTMERIATEVLATLDGLGIAKAFIGGVSMGGYAAMAITRAAPERVLGLILLDTQASADDEAAKEGREKTARAVLESGPSVLLESLVPKLLAEEAASSVRERVEAMTMQNDRQAVANALRGMALRKDSTDVLRAYAGPALVLVGEEDKVTPPEKATAMKEALSDAELHVIAKAGHLTPLEAPEETGRLLRAFVTGRRPE